LLNYYDQKGDYKRAEPFYLRALALAEKPNSGLEPFFVATILNGIGRLYDLQGDFLRAEPLLQTLLWIYKKRRWGGKTLRWRQRSRTWGVMYQTGEIMPQAEQLLVRALAIREKAAGN